MYKIITVTKEQEARCWNKYLETDDKEHLTLLFQAAYGIFYKYCRKYHMLQEDIEDFIQDCYYRLLKELKYFNPDKARFTTFLSLIFRSTLSGKYESSKVVSKGFDITHTFTDVMTNHEVFGKYFSSFTGKSKMDLGDTFDSNKKNPEEICEQDEIFESLGQAIEARGGKQYIDLFYKNYVLEQTQAEIAKEQNITAFQIYSKMRFLRKQLEAIVL